MKVCKMCHEEKPLSEFHRHPCTKDGHRGKCKTCRSKEEKGRKIVVSYLPMLGLRKACTKCKVEKDGCEFYKNPRSKNGYTTECKECRRKDSLKNYYLDPEKTKLRNKAIRDKPDNSERRRKEMLRQYGLTLAQYEEMFKSQDSKCAICKSSDVSRKNVKNWLVDHCHKTGLVRGILCHKCNTGLGHFVDSRDNLRAAIKYLDDAETELIFSEVA